MGYETTLIVVEANYLKKDGRPYDYMSIAATIELCKANGGNLDSLRIQESNEDYIKDIN